MIVIAVDEAGYGPKLGPLVVAATCWEIPESENRIDIDLAFESLRKPSTFCDKVIAIDDSKKVFKQGSADRLRTLQAIVASCRHWVGQPSMDDVSWLRYIARDDIEAIMQTPWLCEFSFGQPIDPTETKRLASLWNDGLANLVSVQTRVITAKQFNAMIESGMNKSDVLSLTTLSLVSSVLESVASEDPLVRVYCDRHGGRQFYAGVLQHQFNEMMLRIVSESKKQSHYQLTNETRSIDIWFTVKGDSFAPVSLSSLHAKYLREVFMDALNAYFAAQMAHEVTLKPTAGYPVDADRYLKNIEGVIKEKRISTNELVRLR